MARRKNTKFIDPRYFMNEKMEGMDEELNEINWPWSRKKPEPVVVEPEAAKVDSIPEDFNTMVKSEYFRKQGRVLEALKDAIEAYDEDYKKYLRKGDRSHLEDGIFRRRMKQYFSEMRDDDRMWDLYDIYKYIERKKEDNPEFNI